MSLRLSHFGWFGQKTEHQRVHLVFESSEQLLVYSNTLQTFWTDREAGKVHRADYLGFERRKAAKVREFPVYFFGPSGF